MIRFATLFGTIVLLSFALRCTQSAAEEEHPAYVCRFAAGPIKVDGQLDEPAWQHAQQVKLLYPFRPETATNLPSTTARLLWDKSSLYLAWQAEDTDIWSYSDKGDDPLWKGDVVELYLKPSKTDLMYYEIDIAPNGAIFDARFPSRGAGAAKRFQKWSAKARIATHLEGTNDQWQDTDQGYTVEVAIPLAAFVESGLPKAGAVWTFGLFRCDYTSTYDNPRLFSSLSGKLDPTHGFHSYEQYQPLLFEGHKATKK